MCHVFSKRIIPFILTFAVGLLIASFFVSITPSFKFRKARFNQRKEMQQLRYENERLELENQRLQQKLEEREKMFLLEAPVPPPPPPAPVQELEVPKISVKIQKVQVAPKAE
jgi:hypothetical protein